MCRKEISEDELGSVYIGDTGVTVLDVICALCDVLDGEQEHDLPSATGLSLERCHQISETRYEVQPIWLKQL